MKYIYLALVCLSFGLKTAAQSPPHQPGEMILQFRNAASARDWQATQVAAQQNLRATAFSCVEAVEPIAPALNLWLLRYRPNCADEQVLLRALRRDPAIVAAQFNHLAELRGTLPNDPLFKDQWQWFNQGQGDRLKGLDIGLTRAWDFTTGGISPQGDSIVVAILDTGVDTAHKDLRFNFWYNRQEIPNNRRDDDENGYVDDYRGWNTQSFNDDINDLNGHGTGVAGMVGAKGNNGIGGTGVNWDVKLMNIVWGGQTSNEERLLRGFVYAYQQRKLYNATQGKKGAFVVAINASFGLFGAKAEDYPIWCSVLDSLGKAGVITVNATAKDMVNVEEKGDIPSDCSSPYLIVVTNIDGQGKLVQAYGPATVDLAAPAQNILSTRLRSAYRELSGTSFAAPQVAGAIALLYASPCGHLSELARQQPAAAAELARDLILKGILPLEDLRDKVSTGGLLRVDNSLRLLSTFCAPSTSSPSSPVQIKVAPNPFQSQLLLSIQASIPVSNGELEVFNLAGQILHRQSWSNPGDFPSLISIDTQNWSAGLYGLRMKWGGQGVLLQKVIKL